jgi:hypothetical protein
MRSESYWGEVGRTDVEERWLEARKSFNEEYGTNYSRQAYRRRVEATAVRFYGALSAAAGSATTGNQPLSLATCEKVPTSNGDAEPSRDFETRTDLFGEERDVLRTAYRHDIGAASIDELAEAVTSGVDAAEALHEVMGRSDERQANVVALIRAGEVAHAKRLATCGRQSVQLECPDEFGAGGCGHTENYVPISCDSRLCPDCGSRRQGQAMERFGGVVNEWDAPTAIRLSLPERVEARESEISRAVDALRGAFGRLRRRVVPTELEHDGRRVVWEDDGGEPASCYWKPALMAEASRRAREDDDRSLFRRIAYWEREYVEQGRGIPMDELLESGIYGVDAKQSQEDGTVNVHLHILADCPYIPQAALSKLWDDLTDAPVVDIRRVEDRDERGRDAALMETVGYAAKPPEYETVQGAVAYVKALKGSKLIQPFGDLHGNTPQPDAELLCGRCENTPNWWNYMGTVNERLETMGTTWEDPSAGDGPPPE